MTKTLTLEQKKKMLSDKYIGVFPFSFDEDGDAAEDAKVVIPDTIHLIPIGQWEHDVYGPILITASDIREFVQNFNAKIRKGVPITAGHEGFEELPAKGWIVEVEARDTGLWGKVEWNEGGIESLSDKEFKFFSPEFYRDYEDPQTHQIYRNVLTGGALTKSPYFKELEAIVFSEQKLKKQFNTNTNMFELKDLVVKDITTLTDEEKAFLKEHKAELTDEQKSALTAIIDEPETVEQKEAREKKEADDKAAADAKAIEDANVAAGLNPDGTAKVEASEKNKGKMIQMSEVEVALLRKQADEGAQAFAEIRKNKITASVKAMTYSESNKAGKFLPKSGATLQAFIESLNEAQVAKFSALIGELPKAELFTEVGKDAVVDGTAQAELNAKVDAKLAANKGMKYSEALKEVMAENKGLEQRYDEELPSAKKAQKL